MSGHTPGPWRTSGPSKVVSAISDGGDYAILDADGEIIAEAIRQVGPSDFRPANANARLIAAAPDLLEALEAILAEDNPTLATMNERLEAGRAAIAKARGEQA